MKIALCGNPNVGKTTLFNRLTKSDEPVGNWHGVTVDVRTKRVGQDYISDIPGAYSLTPRSPEEKITSDAVLFGGYDAFIYVAEVNNLRRNLYMFMQLAEAGKRAVLVVNMMDEAKGKGDLKLLSKRLGVPVIGTSSKSQNPKSEILSAVKSCTHAIPCPDYLSDSRIKSVVREIGQSADKTIPPEFAALKLMEGDERIVNKTCGGACGKACDGCRDYPARLRYSYIDRLLDGAVYRPAVPERTKRIDRVLLGKLALPIFIAVMAAVFVITFECGKPLSDLLVGLVERLGAYVAEKMPNAVGSLIADGVIAGVGGVLAFLPQVVLLFLLTAILQDSGYMSRVAFLTDGFFKKFGLSGRTAFSFVLGLGCSATAVCSTRGIADDGAKRRAAFALPFCPCSARLAVFTAIASYFELSGLVVAGMYVLGVVAALIVVKLACVFKPDKRQEQLIMEMPPYRLPNAKRVLGVVLSNLLSFVLRVGSVVLSVSIVMWLLCNLSLTDGFSGDGQNSVMCTLSSLIAPAFAPLGFGSWQAVSALISGVAAKETVISVIAGLGGMDVVFDSRNAAISFMIFTCLYVPCVATVSALAKENGAKSAALSVLVHTAAAYLSSLIFYQTAQGMAVNARLTIIIWSCAAAGIVLSVAIKLIADKYKSKKAKLKAYGKKV